MRFFPFLIAGFSFLVLSCSGDDGSGGGTTPPPTVTTASYFPLAEGNYWVYDLSTNGTSTGQETFTLGAGTVVDGIPFHPITPAGSGELFGGIDNVKIGQSAAITYFSGEANAMDFGLEVDYPFTINQKILDENASAGSTFDSKTESVNLQSISATNPPIVLKVYNESRLIGNLASISLNNGKSYSDIRNSRVNTSIELLYELRNFPAYTTQVDLGGLLGVQNVTVKVNDRDLIVLNKSVVSYWDLFFAKDIGLAKLQSVLDPSALELNSTYTVPVTVSLTDSPTFPPVTVNATIDFTERTITATAFNQTIERNFQDISPQLVTAANYFDTVQDALSMQPTTQGLAELFDAYMP